MPNPRPLRYSTAKRQEAYEYLRLLLTDKDIDRKTFNKKIEALNKAETKKRANDLKKKMMEKEKLYSEQRRGILKRTNRHPTRFGNDFYEQIYQLETPIEIADVIKDGFTHTLTENAELLYNDVVSNVKFSHNGSILIRLEVKTGEDAVNYANKWVSLGKAIHSPYNKSDLEDLFGTKLIHLADSTIQSDGKIVVIGYSVCYIPAKPTQGGCDYKVHKKRIGDLKTMSPQSKNNDCLFMCIHSALDLKGNYLALDTRKKLGLEKGSMIHIDTIEPIAKHYNISIHLHDMDGERIKIYNSDAEKIVNIMLYITDGNLGHYVLITNEIKNCDKCLHSYFKEGHKCNVRRQMWVNRHKGLRQVIPSKVFKDIPFQDDKMFYFDLETFKPNDTDAIIPYAVGWYNKTYRQLYGSESWNGFMNVILNLEDKIICAYNGSGFDFHFLMTEILNRDIKISNVIMNNGRLMSFTFGNNNRCWDLCLFTLSSLDNACNAFGVSDENKKTSFDHFKIKSWDDVELYRNEVEPYMKRDVMGMREVYEKFSGMMFDIFKVHMVEFVTLSSLSYAIWTSTVNSIIELPNTEKYEFIRNSLYGGRTYPMVREYTSKHYQDIILHNDNKEELKKIYSNMDDYVFNGDVTSLYPTAMVEFKYPTGISSWNDNATEIKIGIYDVDVECNKDLIVPILPRKSPKGGIIWDLIDRRGIYTSVDLNNAIKYGYKITKIHNALEWETEGDIFTDYIMKAYKIKEENDDNPVKRQIGKILMNALYGKMLERARFEETKMCSNINDVYKFMKEYNLTDIQFIKDKALLTGVPINCVISDDKIRKPCHIGTFILSYSRTIMLNTMSIIEPKLDSHFFTYTDTDSLHVHASKLPLWEKAGLLQKGLGKVSDDAKGGRIFREINLAPKLYMYLCLMPDGKIKSVMKSKGIPAQYLSPHLFENADTLEDNEKLINMEHRLKKVGYGKHLQTAWRKYDAFAILSVDMERTFYKNMWMGMKYEDNKFYPIK